MKQTPLVEHQRFNQFWLLLILGVLVAIGVAVAIAAIATKAAGILLAISPLLFILLIVALFQALTLEVEIQNEGIRYRYLPFLRRWRTIPRTNIKQISVVKYDPIGDFGGWGIHKGRKGWAYTVKGNDAISILLLDGKHIMIGTSKPEEVRSYLDNCGYK